MTFAGRKRATYAMTATGTRERAMPAAGMQSLEQLFKGRHIRDALLEHCTFFDGFVHVPCSLVNTAQHLYHYSIMFQNFRFTWIARKHLYQLFGAMVYSNT